MNIPANDNLAMQRALEAILHLGSLSQTEIGAKLLKSGGYISLIIDILEKMQLVTRQRSNIDRRLVIVSLTQAGQELISEIFLRHAQVIRSELSILNPAEQEQLGYRCRKLGRGLAEHKE
jgi:MarR family 2-MHQ and catechol resistance regulon transcriptional repressor